MGSDSALKPKRIHVFVNGNSSERIFYIHPKCRLSWSSIINFMGGLLKPQLEDIKVLRKTNGRPVNSYEELEDNGKYVACGEEPLISLPYGYRTDSEMDMSKELIESSSSENMYGVGGKLKYLNQTTDINVMTIYVFINGMRTKPNTISLTKKDLYHWDSVFSLITKQMQEPIESLYTIFGERLNDPMEIHHKGFYVALPEGSQFEDVSYLSIFSAKKQRKVRFKRTTQQTSSTVSEALLNEKAAELEKCTEDKKAISIADELPSKPEDKNYFHSYEVVNINDPTQDSPCVHVTIVQRPMSKSRYTPGVLSTRPSAKLVLEMLGDRNLNATCQECKSTQTSATFCEALPKGKCVIEVASKKFHIISDEDTIVLPCGTYFSSRRSMKKPCIFPVGTESLSLEDLANRIVGIVVDTSEYTKTRHLYGLEQALTQVEDTKEENKTALELKTESSAEGKDFCSEFLESISL